MKKFIVIRSVMLDSTVFGVALSKKEGIRQHYSEESIELVRRGLVSLVASVVIKKELLDTPIEEIKEALMEIYNNLSKIELPLDDDVIKLAEKYLEKTGIIRDDALIVATASKNNIDALVSWNRRRLVSEKIQREIKKINDQNGYSTPFLLTPEEFIENGKYSATSGGVLYVFK